MMTAAVDKQIILEVKDLRTHFFTRRGLVKAVDGVSFSLRRQESIGLVGESGCGKSVTALSLVRLVPQPAGKIVGGEVNLLGENLLKKSDDEMRHIRGRLISMVLQDPMVSLNPVFKIGSQIGDIVRIHDGLRGASLREKTEEMLRLLKIPSPRERLDNYPHELSGGMRQRVVSAMALSCQPLVLIADEPTTSLDVTIQAQYLKLLRDIQLETSMSLIFITHDFGIVAQMCDYVNVMYSGRVVEGAPVLEIFDRPVHPYTQALMAAVPGMQQGKTESLYNIEGQPPDLYDLPSGCYFRPRCTRANEQCKDDYPPYIEVYPEHFVSCWRSL